MDTCEVCGEQSNDHDHSADAVVIRDGWRGQYLAPTFVLDVDDLVPNTLDADVVALADRWLAEMGTLTDSALSSDEYDAVLDAATYAAESALADAGYVSVSDDGYVIYRVKS